MALTEREREILGWIHQNPMISQQELAQLCGITRSGVAAHISKLIHKGYVQGKGYVLAPPEYTAIVGAINMDIFAIADEHMVELSSNMGHITMSLGGIGRNIAFELTRLEVPCYLVSVFGSDHNGELFKVDARANGMNIAYSKQIMGADTSTYLSVRNMRGEQIVGLDDMHIIERITPQFLTERRTLLERATNVVIDTSLTAEAIDWICEHVTGRIFARVVSVNKAQRLLPVLDRIDTVALSSSETEVLLGITVTDEASADACAEMLIKRGVKHVLICVDNTGMLYRNATQCCFMRFSEEERGQWYKNGVASAALAALVWAAHERLEFEESARYAIAAANVTMRGIPSTNPDFSELELTEVLRAPITQFRDCCNSRGSSRESRE